MLSPWQLVFLVLTTIGGLAVSYLLNIPLAIGFLCGLLLLIYNTIRIGMDKKQIFRSMAIGAGHTKDVAFILLFVGLMIPSWTASGTIPYMIRIGLSLLDPTFLVTGSFVLAAVISMTLGTSTGTLSAIGIPMIGVAAYLQIPLPLVAGALVSGAFVGDRTSPFSSAFQLVASSTGISLRQQGRTLLPTTALAIAACLGCYISFDVFGNWGRGVNGLDEGELNRVFHYSFLLLIPPMLLIGAILFRIKTKYAFVIAILASLLLGTIMQKVSLTEWGSYLWLGYEHADLPTLHGKGVADMISLVVLIVLAGAFNGLLEETRMMIPYVRKILGSSKSLSRSTFRAALFGLGLGLISCTQTLPIMMSGRNLLPVWTERFDRMQLARVVADTSLIFAAMVPWNMLAILCSTIIGVSIIDYLPYAVFLWILPLLTLGLSWIFDVYKKTDNQRMSG